jgi:2-oxoglutarate ferredoxin oxidoreductase subunit gamma
VLEEILIAGFGGQGVMLMGQLLAYGAIYEGCEVTFFPSYGPEMRGGTANCTVVISDQRIGSPIRNTFTALMAMNQASLAKFEDRVKIGGVLAYNETLIDTPPRRRDVKIVQIPANEIATELGSPQVANMAAMGGLVKVLGIMSLDSLCKGLKRVIPKYRHHLIPLNEEAIRRGMEVVQGNMKAMEG